MIDYPLLGTEPKPDGTGHRIAGTHVFRASEIAEHAVRVCDEQRPVRFEGGEIGGSRAGHQNGFASIRTGM